MKETTKERVFLGISKPSQALFAMCDGLEEADEDPKQGIRMFTFGDVRGDVCWGCAATWTVQKLSGKKFTPESINCEVGFSNHANFIGVVRKELADFENAIDSARRGA